MIPPTITHWLQNPLIETFGWTLLHSLWQLPLVAACAAILLLPLRRASANVRYLLCCAALAIMALLLVATFLYLLPAAPHGSHFQILSPKTGNLASPEIATLPPAALEISKPIILAPTPLPATVSGILQPLIPYTVLVYFGGALFLSCRLLIGYTRLRQLRNRAIPADPALQVIARTLIRRFAITRPVRLLESALVEVPSVIGAFRPIVLFPATALTGLSADQLTGLLAHELAHIRRHDYLINLIQTLVETLLFYHPGVWWVSAKIRQEREHACDDLALSTGITRFDYAHALTQMESLRAPAALTLAANSGSLLPRIRRILQGPAPGRLRSITLVAILLPAALLAMFLGIVACNRSPAPVAASSQPAATAVTTLPATNGQFSRLPSDRSNADTPANRAVHARLEEEIGDFSFDSQSFQKVIDAFRDKTSVNIYVNWTALHESGIERDTLVSINFHKDANLKKGVPFRKALATLLSEVAGDKPRLGYTIDDGVLTISTHDDLESAKYQVVRVFDIRDLLTFSPEPPIAAITSPAEKPAVEPMRDPQQQQVINEQQRITKEIIDTVQSTVAPDSWRDKGGKIGSIRELNGQLIVNQTVDNQTQVYNLLQQLRETRAVCIPIELRAILLNEEDYKKLASDFLNSTDKEGQLRGGVLDAAQNAKFTEALKSLSTTTIAEKKTIAFNGQTIHIPFTSKMTYISGYQTVNQPGLPPEFLERYSTVHPGFIISSAHTVSADRRYVVSKVSFTSRKLLGMKPSLAPSTPPEKKLLIETPELSEVQPSGMLSVPAGGTVVVSGPKVTDNLLRGILEDPKIKNPPSQRVLLIFTPRIIIGPREASTNIIVPQGGTLHLDGQPVRDAAALPKDIQPLVQF